MPPLLLVTLAVAFAVVGWIAVVPIGVLLYSTVSATRDLLPFEATRLTLVNFAQLVSDPTILKSVLNTAIFAIGATALGLSISIFFAWVIERTDLWLRGVFFVAILLPMAVPNMVYAMSWIQLLGPNNGLLTTALDAVGLGAVAPDVFSLGAMIFIQGLAMASHAFLLVAAPFRMLDPSWEEQSRICGKGMFTTLGRVTLPVLKPALLAAAIFFAIISIETFDVPITLGLTKHIDVLSTRIYNFSHPETGQLPDYGSASALASLAFFLALVLIGFYHRQTRNAKQFVAISGRGYRPRRIELGVWRLPLFLIAALYVVVGVALPLFMLVWRSLLRFYVPPSFGALSKLSLAAYGRSFYGNDGVLVVTNTTVIAVVASVATVALAALVAWVVVRSPVRPIWRRGLNTMAFLPQAVPSVVIGLALMLIYLWLPVPIYGTIWIIALGMMTKFLPYATGTMVAAQMQVGGELEEASQIAGAGKLKTYRRVVAPLISPALMACVLWIVIHVIRELGIALMLYSGDSQVLSTAIWRLWQSGNVNEACAISVFTILALIVVLAIPWMVQRVRAAARRIRLARIADPAPEPGLAFGKSVP